MSDTDDLVKEFIKKELRSVEITEELVEEHDVEDIEVAVQENAEDALNKLNTNERKVQLFWILGMLGQNVGSENIQEVANAKIQQYGDDVDMEGGPL